MNQRGDRAPVTSEHHSGNARLRNNVAANDGPHPAEHDAVTRTANRIALDQHVCSTLDDDPVSATIGENL